MCGIYGFSLLPGVDSECPQVEDMLEFLAVANERRGPQAWGTYSPERGIIKATGLVSNAWDVLLGQRSGFAHTRFATSGASGRKGAHPWHLGRIIGAHNGQVYNADELRLKHGYPGTVDSQVLLAHLSAGRDMADLEGYGAIEWVEVGKPEKGIHIARVSESGELWAASIPNLGVVWTSDKCDGTDLLEWVDAPLKEVTTYALQAGATYVAREGALYHLPARASLLVTPMIWGGGWSAGRYGETDRDEIGFKVDRAADHGVWVEEECSMCGTWHTNESIFGLCERCSRYAVGV